MKSIGATRDSNLWIAILAGARCIQQNKLFFLNVILPIFYEKN